MYQSQYHWILFPVLSTVSIIIKQSSSTSTLWHTLLHLWLDYLKTGQYNLGCAYVVTEKCLTGANNQVFVIDVGFLKLNKCTVNWHFWASSISRIRGRITSAIWPSDGPHIGLVNHRGRISWDCNARRRDIWQKH